MPILYLRTSPGLLDAAGNAALVERLTDACLRAESIADPARRTRAIVVARNDHGETIYRDGVPLAPNATAGIVLVDFVVGDGVLDPVRRHRFARDLREAVEEVTDGAADQGRVFTSVIFHDVPEGRWGRDGRIVRLPAMAADAGFDHLREIAAGG